MSSEGIGESVISSKPSITDSNSTSSLEPIVRIGGSAVILYRHPLITLYKPSVAIYRGQLLLDSRLDRFGLHLDFRIRDNKIKNYYTGIVWMQEVYGFIELIASEDDCGPMVLKLGKIYQQFGRFWDNSFYGNIQLRDGLKIDTDYGLSLQGDLFRSRPLGLKYFLQYFVLDGGTNSSYVGRDTFSAKGTGTDSVDPHRWHMLVGRVVPFIHLEDMAVLRVGISGQYFQVELPDYLKEHQVVRFAGDLTIEVGPFEAWAECTFQIGRSTTDFPIPPKEATEDAEALPGRSSDRIVYLLIGSQFTQKWFSVRYNFSQGDYQHVLNADGTGYMIYMERTHVPGITLRANRNLFLMLEFGLRQMVTSAGTISIDKSIIVTLHGRI